MKALYRFFRSVRLAVVLILVLTVLSLLSTFVPQGQPDRYYTARYSSFVSGLIAATGMGRFFSSILFLAPAFLFTVNLGVCATDRLVKRARAEAKRRYGPDLIHVGLLILIAGGIVTSLARQEKLVWMAEGDEVALNRSYAVKLLRFEFQKYVSGAPKDWISTVRVIRDGKTTIASFPIEVNHPLRLAGLRIYQSSWTLEGAAHLRDAGGALSVAATGQGFQDGDSFWYFAEVSQPVEGNADWQAVFEEWKGDSLASTRTLAAGDPLGPFTVERVSGRLLTGLKAVRDPGFAPVVVALVMIAAGLALAFAQKRGDVAA
ncbi:MAG: cytochrome c biogenesis protein ResB [Spirochaetes bacterium]|nr:cytochrome c biogenesis protein ResB [Spirochaetota bacterium]